MFLMQKETSFKYKKNQAPFFKYWGIALPIHRKSYGVTFHFMSVELKEVYPKNINAILKSNRFGDGRLIIARILFFYIGSLIQ